jgi:hypothetical protein
MILFPIFIKVCLNVNAAVLNGFNFMAILSAVTSPDDTVEQCKALFFA